ncbi:hypothetical protein ALO45_200053 [Pseudomonas syringae pv. syringae]|nr:hypothetical protein ALO45_200053 [Pseudomonas syringae pv. syringae]
MWDCETPPSKSAWRTELWRRMNRNVEASAIRSMSDRYQEIGLYAAFAWFDSNPYIHIRKQSCPLMSPR